MTEEQDSDVGTLSATGDGEETYRHLLADTILSYARNNGELSEAEAYKQIIAVTGKAPNTVRNWLSRRLSFPDLASLARIASHWKIPNDRLIPPNIGSVLGGDTGEKAEPIEVEALRSLGGPEHTVLWLYGGLDFSKLDKILSSYAPDPRRIVFVRYLAPDMQDEIRQGELIAVDPAIEAIEGLGFYYLRFSLHGQPDQTCVRLVEPLLSEPAVRVSCGSAMPATTAELIPLKGGRLPSHVTVLGRVVGILRRT